ncbi:MAG TPA: glycerol-3-phosphate acyltransferase [Anaerolineae bacterium]|nr:glycerol-3-phosphate acyltransferase [Anaerolineae bacterium]
MSIDATLLALLVIGYIFGSVPYAVIVSRARGVDIRAVGSKNPGAHNVMGHVGRGWGWLVTILDLLKGALPALLAKLVGLSDWAIVAVGVAAMLGHITSPFLGFKGGKGVATGFGMLLVLAPVAMVTGSVIGLTILRVTRLVALSAGIALILTFGLMIAAGASGAALAAPWIVLAISAAAAAVDEMHKTSGSLPAMLKNVLLRGASRRAQGEPSERE